MQWIYLGYKNNIEYFTCVDDDTFQSIGHLLWSHSNGYAKCSHRDNLVYLHKMILGFKKERNQIIHLNGNKLDNRKSNLILKSQFKNQLLSKGVRFDGNKWISRIRHNSKQIYLGSYETELEAQSAYLGAWYALEKENKIDEIPHPTEKEKQEAIAYRYVLLKKIYNENSLEISKNKKPITNEKGEIFESIKNAVDHYGKKTISTLRNHLNGQTNTCYGLKWWIIQQKYEP